MDKQLSKAPQGKGTHKQGGDSVEGRPGILRDDKSGQANINEKTRKVDERPDAYACSPGVSP